MNNENLEIQEQQGLIEDEAMFVSNDANINIFNGDKSSSMNGHSGSRTKWEILLAVLLGYFTHVRDNSSMASTFQYIINLFNHEVHPVTDKNGNKMFGLHSAIDTVTNANWSPSGSTAIHLAIEQSTRQLDDVFKDTQNPEMDATVFIYTDGRSDEQAAINAANQLKAHPLTPALVTVGIGNAVKEQFLIDLASDMSLDQERKLSKSGVLGYFPNKQKLYIKAHDNNGNIEESAIKALRNMMVILTKTS